MRAAFFDVDGTLASSNVVSCYADLQLRQRTQPRRMLWTLLFAPKVPYYMVMDRLDRSTFSRRFFRNYRNVPPWRLEHWINNGGPDYWQHHLLPGALRCIEWHRQQGDQIVLASGGVEQSLIPLARLISPDQVICARLERQANEFTGRLQSGPIVGPSKAEAVRRLGAQADLDLSQCYAYGDSYSDREFLDCVGHPVAVNPDRALRRLAESQGWPVLDCNSDDRVV